MSKFETITRDVISTEDEIKKYLAVTVVYDPETGDSEGTFSFHEVAPEIARHYANEQFSEDYAYLVGRHFSRHVNKDGFLCDFVFIPFNEKDLDEYVEGKIKDENILRSIKRITARYRGTGLDSLLQVSIGRSKPLLSK
uniref:Uncharacterized protein n=1 Tax=Rhizobium phage IG49 TaxID=3129228 RepID=A0AAU8HYK8_9CAUD